MTEDRRQQPDRRAPGREGGRRASDVQPEWLSVSDYARVHDVSRPTVYKWIASQIVDAYRVGSVVRVKNMPPRVNGCQL